MIYRKLCLTAVIALFQIIPSLCSAQLKKDDLGKIPATTLQAPIANVTSIGMSHNGKIMACAGFTTSLGNGKVVSSLFLLSFPEGKILRNFLEKGDYPPVTIALTNDGKKLMGAGPGLRIWDVGTGKLEHSINWDWEPKWHLEPSDPTDPTDMEALIRGSNEVYPAFPLLSPDLNHLYVCGSKDEFRVIDPTTEKELKRVKSLGMRPVCFASSPDCKKLAVTTPDALIVYRTDTFAEVGRTSLRQARATKYYCVSFFDNEQLLVMGPSGKSETGEIRIWNCKKNEFTDSLPPALLKSTFRPYETKVAVIDSRYALVSPGTRRSFDIYDLKEKKYLGWTSSEKGNGSPLYLTPDKKELIGGFNSEDMIAIKVEDVLKLISKAP